MKHQLSFATVTLLSNNIAEVVMDKGVELSLEMIEESDAFFAEKFNNTFGILLNKVHHYNLSFEAKLSVASFANLKAIAVVHYTKESELDTKKLSTIRAMDSWNLKSFSGLDLGWQQAFDWLKKELSTIS